MSYILKLAALLAMAASAADLPRPAPALSLTTWQGSPISLERLRGKVVLLEFMSTECKHCQAVAGHLAPLYKELRPRGLELVAVATDPDAKQRIPDFVKRFGATFPMAPGDVPMLLSFGQVPDGKRIFFPYMFLIDRRGRIRFEHEGGDQAFFDNAAANLRAELDLLLNEKMPSAKSGKKR